MSRPGVSFADVASAASELSEGGINPTIEHIRRKLGTGSSTTISNHLREWKASLTNATVTSIKESIPHDLVSIVKGLWERVVDQSEEKIQFVEAEAGKKVENLEQDLHKYRNNSRRWQQLFYRWQKEKELLLEKQREMEAQINQQQYDIQSLTLDNKVYQDQLAERDKQLDVLQRNYHSTQSLYNKLYTQLQGQYQKEIHDVSRQRDHFQFEIETLAKEKNANSDIINQFQQANMLLANEYNNLINAHEEHTRNKQLEHENRELKKQIQQCQEIKGH